jgi:hypothetical protein
MKRYFYFSDLFPDFISKYQYTKLILKIFTFCNKKKVNIEDWFPIEEKNKISHNRCCKKRDENLIIDINYIFFFLFEKDTNNLGSR